MSLDRTVIVDIVSTSGAECDGGDKRTLQDVASDVHELLRSRYPLATEKTASGVECDVADQGSWEVFAATLDEQFGKKEVDDAVTQVGCTEIEKQIISALSFARRNPKRVASLLKEKLQYFKGKEFHMPGRVVLNTKEGKAAVNDAIAFLERVAPMGEVTMEHGLTLACEDHVTDIGTVGLTSHQGTDGSSSQERMSRYGDWAGHCGECLWYGKACSGLSVVLALIIDDGVPSRGHRETIYTPTYALVGTKLSSHKVFGNVAAMDFADSYTGNDDEIAARIERGPPEVDIAAADAVKTQWTDLGMCRGCGKQVHGGTVVETQLGKWHKDCFVCTKCKALLSGKKHNVHENAEYCAACYDADFAPRCARCAEVLRDSWKVLGERRFHAACLDAQKKEDAAKKPAEGKSPKASGGKAKAKVAQKTNFAVAKKNVNNLAQGYGDL